MPDLQRLIRNVDEYQQRHRPLAFLFAAHKKFGDDQGGNLAALLTYYGFLSIFPLLLVLVTVLGFVLENNADLREDILNSAVADFPIIGAQIRDNVGSVPGNGLGLVIGILVALYGGMGIANAAQDAMNRVWAVPFKQRPGFLPRRLRSLGLLATLGVAIIVTTGLGGFGAGTGELGWPMRIASFLVAFALNVALFAVAFRVLTTCPLSWGDVLPGALIAATGWVVLQAIGGAIVTHQLQGMSETYGLFAIVIGLLAWIFLQARIVLYAAEVNVVRKLHLWPRSLAPPPLTEADQRAYKAYAKTEERLPEERVAAKFEPDSADTADEAEVHP